MVVDYSLPLTNSLLHSSRERATLDLMRLLRLFSLSRVHIGHK